MTRSEESELIARIVQGETELFENLVLAHQKTVYNLALRMLRHPEDAQDCAQEAFLRAYRALGQFRGEASFGSWLYRLTTNVCLDELRRRKRRDEISLTVEDEDGDDIELPLPDESMAPESLMEQKERREMLQTGLETLAPEFRSILLLREVAGLSYEEIGAELSLEAGTVKSRLFRARKKLAQYLAASGNFCSRTASEGKEVW